MRLWVIAVAASLVAGGALAKGHKKHARHVKHSAPAATAETAPPPRAAGPDGAWSVESTTTVGNCAALIPSALQIADGKIASSEGAPVESWGYVDESGAIVARFTSGGEHVARFHGTLKGGRGSGAWSSSTDMCGGTWKAAQQ